MRLDRKKTALQGGDSGPVIVRGKSTRSELIRRVSSSDPNEVMPPKGKRLTAEQVNLLRLWIDQGADWPLDKQGAATESNQKHWFFQTPVRPSLPAVKQVDWARNPIDQFILARLERERLQPSPPADKVTLIRRLSLDLIGLPPSIPEVDAFLSDNRDGAYERLMERLLASPHYGERWGRHWLDAARYSDSDGYEQDKPRVMWFYRDWVINALNRDMPL